MAVNILKYNCLMPLHFKGLNRVHDRALSSPHHEETHSRPCCSPLLQLHISSNTAALLVEMYLSALSCLPCAVATAMTAVAAAALMYCLLLGRPLPVSVTPFRARREVYTARR